MAVYPYGDKEPRLAAEVYQFPGSRISGDVTLGSGVSVWFNVVLRGDLNRIEVGEGTNLQEGSVVHVDVEHPTKIGSWVTVGHGAIVHGCTIGDESLVGMGAIILNGAVIGEQCIIGAGALVTEGKVIPPGSLVIGSPGRVVRELTEAERAGLKAHAIGYRDLAKGHFPG